MVTSKLETIMRAIDWLAANPEKHIAGTLAADSIGNSVTPFDPRAECFCVLGRIALEAKVGEDAPYEGRVYTHLETYLQEDFDLDTDAVYGVNDNFDTPNTPEQHEVIENLRKLFKENTK